jgi:hypothetical protein
LKAVIDFATAAERADHHSTIGVFFFFFKRFFWVSFVVAAMVSLKVRVPSLEGIGDEEDARKREKRLKKVETVLQKLVGREARMWLITALASLEVPSQVQASCFLDLFSNSLRASRVSRGDEEEEEEMQVGECFPEPCFSFELGQFLLQKEITTCFFCLLL